MMIVMEVLEFIHYTQESPRLEIAHCSNPHQKIKEK